MGISYHVTLGAYFECKTKEVKQSEKFRACDTDGCSDRKRDVWDTKKKFCAECGGAIKDLSRTKRVPAVDPFDTYYEACKESIYHEDLDEKSVDGEVIHRYLSNRGIGHERHDPHSTANFVQEIDEERAQRDIDALEAGHKNEFNYLMAVYGEDNVRIKWGLILTSG